MKIKPLIAICVSAGLATSALSVARDPSDAFRSDTTLGFMGKLHTQNPKEMTKDMKDGMKDLQKGPEYDSKKAQKATAKASEQHKKNPPASNPFASANNAITKAGDGVGDAFTGKVTPFGHARRAEDKFNDHMDELTGTGQKKNKKDQQEHKDQAPPPTQKKQQGEKQDQATPLEQHWKTEDQFNKHMDNMAGSGKNEKEPEEQATPLEPQKVVQDDASKVEEPREEVASIAGCKNKKGWIDAKGQDCEDYAEGEFCTRKGGYGDAWLDEWGKFEDVKNQGKTAIEACCACGGGGQDDSSAPGPAPAGSPAAGPAPGPAVAWDSMAIRPLQAQGFDGENVMHEDQETMTGDWGREFGPGAGHRDVKTICKEHPDNEWCDLHGFRDKPKSAATSLTSSVVAIFAAALLMCLR